MAITATQQSDTRYRVNSKYVVNAAANTNVSLLDCSALLGFETGGLVNIAKISWWSSAPSGGLDIIWDGSPDVIAFICEGASGTYGFMPGQPAIANNAGTATGDVLITNASATFTLVIEYHKQTTAGGKGWTASG